jgi:beta-mannanase
MKKLLLITCISLVLITFGYVVYNLLPQRTILFGAWHEGFFDAKTRTLHPEKLKAFEKIIDKKVSIAHYYRGWEYLADPILIEEFNTIRDNGWQPMLNVNPYYFDDCPATDEPLYRAIANGQCDEFLRKAGKNLSKIDKPFYLLFAWEMNNKDLPWSIPYTTSTPQEFQSAWRHIHTILEKEEAKNIIWVFAPNTYASGTPEYIDMYPGDAYVDWTGIDGYNWGESQSWSNWSSFSGTFTTSYRHLVSIAPSKPIMIAEFNTTDKGGDKAGWYKEALTKEIPYNFPQIKAIVLYNEDRTKQENVNRKVDVTATSLESFKKAIQTKFYK